MINEPKYDGDLVTKSYVDRATGALENEVTITQQELETSIGTINKTYGAAPNPPYLVGNLYVDGTNLYRCKTERLIGSFNAGDWELATAYPTTSYVDSTYTKPADFAVTGTVDVNGGRITAGSIASVHYVANTTGMKINLDNDTIDSKNFKVNSEGIITATNAILSGTLTSTNVNITGGQLDIGSGNFKVTNSGIVTAKSITLTGNIESSNFTGGNINIGNGTFTVNSSGVLTATQANINGTINATGGTFDNCTINGTSSINSAAIPNLSAGKITSGMLDIYNGTGFLRMGYAGSSWTNHPYVSALNVAAQSDTPNYDGYNSSISFRSSINRTAAGNQIGFITGGYLGDMLYDSNRNTNIEAGGNMRINASGYVRISASDFVRIANLKFSGTSLYNDAGIVKLHAYGSNAVWAEGNNLPSSRIVTAQGSSSSRILKENIKEFDENEYNESIELLKKIKIYEYDYKYPLYKDKHQFGFIIDELEEQQETKKFFKFDELLADISDNGFNSEITDDNTLDKKNLPDNIIKYKQYDPNVLDKYLLTCLKAQQMKIDNLEEKINGK